jgi:CHAT domain-containing protein/predicted negative regulator of RcsB-dependent stress response
MDLPGKECALGLCLVLALAGCGQTNQLSAEKLYQEAYNLLRSEHYQEASNKMEAGLKRAPPGSAWYWKLRLLKAEILLAKRQLPQALTALEFQLPEGPQWTVELARYRLRQGDAAYFQDNYPEAESRLKEAQKLAESVHASGLMAEIEFRQGSVAVRTEHFVEAESKFQDVRAYADRQGDAYLQMRATGNIGYLLLRSSRFDQAIPWFEKTLAAAQRLGATDSEARAMGNLGGCYYPLGDFDKALHYCEQADSRLERAGNQFEHQKWLGVIGDIYVARHEYQAAAATNQRALSMARTVQDWSSSAMWLNNLAYISIETGEWDAAERYNNEALQIKRERHEPQAYSLVNAARIAAGRKDYARSKEIFESVIRSQPRDHRPLLDAHAGLAQVLAETHRDGEAESEFQAAIAVMERRRAELLKDEYKLIYFSSLIECYQQYVDFLMARGRTDAALEAAESSRARLLADKLKLGSVRRNHTAVEFQKLAGIYSSTLLSYWLAPGKSYLWVITPAKISAVRLPPEPDIRAWVESYDGLIQNLRDPLDTENPAGRKLYEALIAPAQRLMPKTGKVILAPDGPLHSLNFETLPVFEPQPHYWIQDATVSVTPSLGLLSADQTGQKAAARSLLLIGNPISPDERYPALEFAGQEMTAIEHSLPGFRIVPRDRQQAQPEAYAQADPGSFGLIHFVAHATANREEPLESAVILSRSGDNYKLLAKDVIDKRLQAELVTISACRSAGARTYAGEGLVGFSWAFLEAGARNVIAGLWDVNDRSTADLMERLYGELSRGLAPADALRSAKLKLVEGPGAYRKPYYWGPFQVFTRSL